MNRLALALLGTALACGCASARRDADARLATGDAAGAAAAYEALLAAPRWSHDEDLLLLRAATAHALADDEDAAARSRELLDALATRFPASPHRPTAQLLLRLLPRLERVATEAPAAAAAGGTPAPADGAELVELRKTLVELHRQVDRLVAESRLNERKLRTLRDEMEMLKAIDLESPAAPAEEPPRR